MNHRLPRRDRAVLALDIDGVLNSTRSMLLTGPMRNDYEHLDPIAVGLLNRVCAVADPNVVIVSTWREEFPNPAWWEALFCHPRYQANHVRIVACLPSTESRRFHRGTELRSFLKQPDWQDLPAVVVDDSIDYFDNQRRIHVDADVGLSARNACDLLSFLAPESALAKQWELWMPDE